MPPSSITSQAQAVLYTSNADAYVSAHSLGLPAVAFLLERETVTSDFSGATVGTTRSIVAIATAGWAKVERNFNYRVSNVWFDRDTRFRAFQAHLEKMHPELGPEDLRKKINEQLSKTLRARYPNRYKEMHNPENHLVLDRNGRNGRSAPSWGEIDALAKTITEKFKILPDDLTLVLVVDANEDQPSPSDQGLCSFGHQLRFCRPQDLSAILEKLTAPATTHSSPPHKLDAPRKTLKEILAEQNKHVLISRSRFVPRDEIQLT